MPKRKPFNETQRVTPSPTIKQYHASIMHDIMVRNHFPEDTREMVSRLASSVRRHAEAEAVLIKARAEARLNNATASLQESMATENQK